MPRNSPQISESLEPIKKILLDLQKRIKRQNTISQLAGYSSAQIEKEIAYALIFADPEYYFLMGDEYREIPLTSPAEHYNVLKRYLRRLDDSS
jgi:hypothetical protein